MPSSDVPQAQAQELFRTLCNCLLPVIQGTGGQIIDAKEIRFGAQAAKFVAELEKFVSGMISRSRPRSQDIAIEATLEELEDDRLDNFKDDKTTIGAVSSGEANPGEIAANNSIARHHPAPQPMPLSSVDEDLQIHLQKLRKHVTQIMPIRLLLFEPHNEKLKISLVERAEVYNYFSPKLEADYRLWNWLPNNWNEEHVRYAILSHTWRPTPGELTYGDWEKGSLNDTHWKCQKVVNFCKAAWKDHGLMLGWIDTVCINKESSAELDESIRSMHNWYSSADVCITYLAATNMVSNMHTDPWFTRGWTLQELLAPPLIKFYDMDWNKLSGETNDKNDFMILDEIELATTITAEELESVSTLSISRRMQLAAKRKVTREEDIAYCLMGIFGVSISTAYGEGHDRAFFRLVEEIFRSTKDVSDIFNWAGNHNHFSRQPTSLFPSHPSDYLHRQPLRSWHPIEPLTFTHLGLRTPILLMCAVPIRGSVSEAWHQPIGDYRATVSIVPFPDCDKSQVSRCYHLLDKRFDGLEGLNNGEDLMRVGGGTRKLKKISALTFGILNVEKQGTSLHIPKTCLAVLFQSKVELIRGLIEHSPDYSRIYTEKPIVFDLQKTRSDAHDKNKDYYELERNELAKHGMKFDTLYL